MNVLPPALAPMAAYRQFILWTTATRDGKLVKLPVDYRTASVGDSQDPGAWMDAPTAIATAAAFGEGYGVGFVFTTGDPFFFVDLDKCDIPGGWSPVAMDILNRLPGAAVEVSQSGRGLHIFGVGACPEHACKNTVLGLELYTEGRFVALTGDRALGSADVDCSTALPTLVTAYFPPKVTTKSAEWTEGPQNGWNGYTDDDELIAHALASKSAAATFGNRSSFEALWTGDDAVLAEAYHDENRAYDASSADAAIAQHLAFWTGNDCERISRLMWKSGLVRGKWEREDYIIRTIMRAVQLQEVIYTGGARETVDNTLAETYRAPSLKGTAKQQEWATNIRAQKLLDCQGDEEQIRKICNSAGPMATASFWIDNQASTPEQVLASVATVEQAAAPLGVLTGPEVLAGYQFLGVTQQLEHFKGCIYVQELHKVFTPSGALLKSEQFNATYGGYVFQLESNASGKTTRKAWEAFTESQAIRYPKAEATCFRPLLEPGQLITHDGRVLVNSYIPIPTPRTKGDATPFLVHLAKVLPNEQDRAILLAYMAACIQHKGIKFQWAPLIQGTPGNGKSLFTWCVAAAIGEKYTHLPPANEIAEKYNDWLFGRLFIGVEDIYVPEHKKEVIQVLLPMITNKRLAMRAMQQGQVMGDVYANFILNANLKDAVRKSRNDRRFAVFYTAQQTAEDIVRDGMGGKYFPNLYKWLDGDGYAIVADYLESYAIPDELNPAGECHRAPQTSSTEEAISASMGGVEQEILEAIEEGRPGFAGGWISSMALERMLQASRMARAVPHNKRRDVLQALGYDWHPALNQGRVNNVVAADGGKPRLFIKEGHISRNIESVAEVVRAYEAAQKVLSAGIAEAVFGGKGR